MYSGISQIEEKKWASVSEVVGKFYIGKLREVKW